MNQAYYHEPLTQSYIDAFRRLVRETIEEQAGEDSMVNVIFHRIYLVADK